MDSGADACGRVSAACCTACADQYIHSILQGTSGGLFFVELSNDFLSGSSSSIYFCGYCSDCSSNIERISVSQCLS